MQHERDARQLDKHVFLVNADDVPATLAALVAHRLGIPVNRATERIAHGSVYVDGRRRRQPRCSLRAGQRVVVFDRSPAGAQPAATPELQLAYRDEDVVVVDKPAGLAATLPRRGAVATVESFVRRAIGSQARLLHRLDQPASGLLLVSCRPQTRRGLARQIEQHQVRRCYFALVAGSPPAPRWSVSTVLGFDGHRAASSGAPGARPAESSFEVLRAPRGGDGPCLLQVELHTGRTHQIRAQLAEAGLPIVGDGRYGGPPAQRLALHAHALGLRHPDGRWLQVHSPLPAALRRLLRRCELCELRRALPIGRSPAKLKARSTTPTERAR